MENWAYPKVPIIFTKFPSKITNIIKQRWRMLNIIWLIKFLSARHKSTTKRCLKHYLCCKNILMGMRNRVHISIFQILSRLLMGRCYNTFPFNFSLCSTTILKAQIKQINLIITCCQAKGTNILAKQQHTLSNQGVVIKHVPVSSHWFNYEYYYVDNM